MQQQRATLSNLLCRLNFWEGLEKIGILNPESSFPFHPSVRPFAPNIQNTHSHEVASLFRIIWNFEAA